MVHQLDMILDKLNVSWTLLQDFWGLNEATHAKMLFLKYYLTTPTCFGR